jgi:hypothetical protein
MTVVLLDDHLLRDWLSGPDPSLKRALSRAQIATTNLWYARLCKSAAGHAGGALLGAWSETERAAVIGGLIALPEQVLILPMKDRAWRMGQLAIQHHGLSMLGAEAVSTAEHLSARVLVSSRDDGPGIRNACVSLRLRYQALAR